MNTAAAKEISVAIAIGAPLGGGFLAGHYVQDGQRRALIVAPKAEGRLASVLWNRSYDAVAGALSWVDGLANSIAMAEAGSELAQKIRALRVGGHEDWCLPAVDQLEIVYRAFKPAAQKNNLWARSGINLSSLPPSWPYTEDLPGRTEVEIFRAGGAEAFEEAVYWTSTQRAGYSDYAWLQGFGNGFQYNGPKDYRYMACAVRSVPI